MEYELEDTAEVRYFCVDDKLLYQRFASDFGPLNFGMTYHFCVALQKLLRVCVSNLLLRFATFFIMNLCLFVWSSFVSLCDHPIGGEKESVLLLQQDLP